MSEPVNNLEYLYNHLPSRFRVRDTDLFLKRYLTWIGEQFDGWDHHLDTFYLKINPEEAPEEFIDFWLWALFGWSWYPSWFTLARKRFLYADFATHLARRGTWFGIEDFLRAFSIHARVFSRPLCYEEMTLDESGWSIDDALAVVVQVSHVTDEVNLDIRGQGVEEMCLDEGIITETRETLTLREIEDLIRYNWPNGQRVMIHYHTRPNVGGPEAWNSTNLIIDESIVPDENSGPITGV